MKNRKKSSKKSGLITRKKVSSLAKKTKKKIIKPKIKKSKSRIKIKKAKPKLSYIKTGSKSLDRLLGKGIIPGTSVLLLGNPHSGKKPILMNLLKQNCNKKIGFIVVLTDLGVNNWISMAKENNWLCSEKDSVYYVDCYSQQFNVCTNSENVKCLEVPFTLSTLSIAVSDYIDRIEKEGKIPVLVFHSLSSLFERFSESELYSFLQFFIGKLKLQNMTSIFTMQLGVHGENMETSISSLMDCIIKMNNGMISASGYISIKDKKWHKYKFVKNKLVIE